MRGIGAGKDQPVESVTIENASVDSVTAQTVTVNQGDHRPRPGVRRVGP